MKKTIISFLLALLLLASCDPEMKHEHSWGEWTVSKAATCTEDGTAVRKCTVCGEEDDETRAIKALGHLLSEEGTVTKKADCGNEGEETFSCTREGCSYKETKVVPATGEHTGGEEQTTEATCTENGKKYKICSVCNKEYDVTVTEKVKGHTWGEWTVKTSGTCTEKESKTHTCTVCKATENVDRDMNPSNHPSDKLSWKSDDAASFLKKTTQKEYCSACSNYTGITGTEDYASAAGYWITSPVSVNEEEATYYVSLDNNGKISMDSVVVKNGKPTVDHHYDCTYEWTTDSSGTRTAIKLIYHDNYSEVYTIKEVERGEVTLTGETTRNGSKYNMTVTAARKTEEPHTKHTYKYESVDKDNHRKVTSCDSFHDSFYDKNNESHVFENGTCKFCKYEKKDHTWSEWTLKTAGTCTTEAVETRTCSDCGKIEEKTGAKNPENHPADKLTWNKISFLSKSGKTGHCSACGADIQQEEGYDSVEGYWVSDAITGTYGTYYLCFSMDNEGNVVMESAVRQSDKMMVGESQRYTYEWICDDTENSSLRTKIIFKSKDNADTYKETYKTSEDNSAGGCSIIISGEEKTESGDTVTISYTLRRKSTSQHTAHTYSPCSSCSCNP